MNTARAIIADQLNRPDHWPLWTVQIRLRDRHEQAVMDEWFSEKVHGLLAPERQERTVPGGGKGIIRG